MNPESWVFKTLRDASKTDPIHQLFHFKKTGAQVEGLSDLVVQSGKPNCIQDLILREFNRLAMKILANRPPYATPNIRVKARANRR